MFDITTKETNSIVAEVQKMSYEELQKAILKLSNTSAKGRKLLLKHYIYKQRRELLLYLADLNNI